VPARCRGTARTGGAADVPRSPGRRRMPGQSPATAAVWGALILDPGPNVPGPPGALSPGLMFVIVFAAVILAFGITLNGVVTSWDHRRSRGQLPPRPGPGGHALEAERRGGTGHGPVPPRPPHRPDPRRPAGSQVTGAPTAYSGPAGPGIPWREAGARHDLTPANQRRDRCLPCCPGRALRLSPHQIFARPGSRQATRERAEPVPPHA
jgi:hypothetical protein